jgi:hypothetical protein
MVSTMGTSRGDEFVAATFSTGKAAALARFGSPVGTASSTMPSGAIIPVHLCRGAAALLEEGTAAETFADTVAALSMAPCRPRKRAVFSCGVFMALFLELLCEIPQSVFAMYQAPGHRCIHSNECEVRLYRLHSI